MRLCQAQCQENKRKVPESPLLTARRGGLTVYATPWSQKCGRRFGSLAFFQQYCGPVFGASSWPHFWDHERATGAAGRSWRPGFRPFAGASHQAAMDTHIHITLWNLDEALSNPLPGKQTKGSGVSATHCTQRGADGVCNTLVPETRPPFWKPCLLPAILQPRFWGWFSGANRSCWTVLMARISSICWRQPSFCNASRHGHTHTHPYNTVKLGWGFVKPIARKTNERFRSLRYSLHAEGAWRCMQHPGPRNGAAVLEALPSSICWRQPSFCIASRHGHTHIHIILISLHIIVEVFIYCIQLSNIYERFRDPRSIERRNVENGLHG